MQIEPLSLLHQDVLEKRLRQLNLPLSEYSFANLYLFRHIHHYEVIKLGKEIFIKGLTRDRISFIMPTSLPSTISSSLIKQVFSMAQILFPIPDNWLILFNQGPLKTHFKEEDCDYIYATSKLAHYSGRHLAGQRNQIKQLMTHYELKSIPLIQKLSDAQQVLDEWQAERRETSPTQTDYLSCSEAIHQMHLLHLEGRIVYLNGKASGFVIGERINQDYYVVHFSKASKTLKGLYPYLFQNLAKSVEGTCPWINLEQDLGIQALRQSKLSYHPHFLAKKWRVQLL
jgi:hypothetical protein